jgi:glycosyltransferase involved in cell wall biosynthesis
MKWRNCLTAVSSKFERLAGSPSVMGYVEHIDAQYITGWAIHRGGKPLQLTLRANGQHFTLTVNWVERSDVAEKHGSQFMYSGYCCTLGIEEKEAIREAVQNNQSFEVLAEDFVLTVANRFKPSALSEVFFSNQVVPPELVPQVVDTPKTRTPSMHWSLLEIEVDSSGVKARIECWGLFKIRGWALVNDRVPSSYRLCCNGVALDCSVFPNKRPDIAHELGVENEELGFEIELPGYLWDVLTDFEDAVIEIEADGVVITPAPLMLSRKTALHWLGNIARMEESKERQYYALLAIEHARYGRLFSHLDSPEKHFFRAFAQKMQLEGFLFDESDEQPENEIQSSSVDVSTLLLWKALRILNKRLLDGAEDVFAEVKSVHDELHLTGSGKQRYIASVIPLLCRHNGFLELRKLVDFSTLYRDYGNNTWEMSLTLGPLVADGHLSQAQDLLYRIVNQAGDGWLNTECIRFAVEHVQLLELKGDIEPAVAERFRYAFLALLDGFRHEWFSRIHDLELIEAMIRLLADVESFTDYHKRDVIAAAIRHYGLCPTFWERLSSQVSELQDSELLRAQTEWRKLHEALSAAGHFSDRLDELRETIQYFHAHGNRESVIILREVIANSLPNLNLQLSRGGGALIRMLFSLDSSEALRVAAFPLSSENRLQKVFTETNSRLLHTIRQQTERDKSVVYDLQCLAAGSLSAAQQAATNGDNATLKAALADLEKKANTLANWQGMFLGADLIAGAYSFASDARVETVGLLMRLGEIIRKAVQVSKAGFFLPSPICAALVCLEARNYDDTVRAFLREIRAIVTAKFGNLHDDLFTPVEKPTLAIARNGWPRDTLVVIYSCRKYLDSRVQAIRESWVTNLQARGIPYVVLVGDGDDQLHGDVLALDVSDRYEDLPKKTLKMFDWIYKNTDAQFVVKIDDDCYLDVARYFDTLSYRKHYYYGRVIRRGIGSMDRVWHQQKSYTAHGKLAIDKSPEPSIYADGGGAYCLSRLAIMKLLAAGKTEVGKRLVASSFMEDKLVGDLLAISHIVPSNEDYESYQRRRTFGAAMPVGMRENTFFPNRLTPTKIVHLDAEVDLAQTYERSREDELWPKKLWPTCWTPTVRESNNQLELLSDPAGADALLQQRLLVVSVVRNEMIILPHFLAHYRKMGIKCFVIVDNCSDDGTREYLFEQPDVILYSVDTEYKHSHYGVAWQQAVLGNLCLGKWVLLVDADEFLVFEGCENRPLADFVDDIEAEGSTAVRTDMVDMYPYGDLDDADFSESSPFETAAWFDAEPLIKWQLGSGMYSNNPSFLSALRHRLDGLSGPNAFTTQKYALVRYQPWVRYSQGLHDVANVAVSNSRAWLAHFKYHAGFKKKVQTEIRRGQHFNNASEYRRYAAMLAEGRGGFGLEGISRRYDGSESFACMRNKSSSK